MKFLLSLLIAFSSVSVFADYGLLKSNRAIECNGADNQVILLNAKRTTVKYSVEGESLGAKKINHVDNNGRSAVSFQTDELTLTLSNSGDTFQYDGGDEEEVDCVLK